MSILIGVLVASLVGSLHCAAMCGGFVCMYSGLDGRTGMRGLGGHVAYHAGRLTSYVTLGLAAGAIGARVDDLGKLASVERGAVIVASTLMILWGAAHIASWLGARVPRLPGNGAVEWVRREFGGLLVALRDQPAMVRSGALGLLTTLLPCGWLYTFVVTAGGTGSAISGAAVMAVFWLGTIPLLFAVGLGVQTIGRPIARHLPVAGAALVMLLGVLSLAGKLRQIPTIGSYADGHRSHTVHGTR